MITLYRQSSSFDVRSRPSRLAFGPSFKRAFAVRDSSRGDSWKTSPNPLRASSRASYAPLGSPTRASCPRSRSRRFCYASPARVHHFSPPRARDGDARAHPSPRRGLRARARPSLASSSLARAPFRRAHDRDDDQRINQPFVRPLRARPIVKSRRHRSRSDVARAQSRRLRETVPVAVVVFFITKANSCLLYASFAIDRGDVARVDRMSGVSAPRLCDSVTPATRPALRVARAVGRGSRRNGVEK